MREKQMTMKLKGYAKEPFVRVEHDHDGREVRLVGRTKGRKCKECISFYREQYSRVITRCSMYSNKFWKANMEACSYFSERGNID